MSSYTRITILASFVSLTALLIPPQPASAAEGTGGGQCVICVQTCSGVNPDMMCASVGGCGSSGQCYDGVATGCNWDLDDQDERVFCNV